MFPRDLNQPDDENHVREPETVDEPQVREPDADERQRIASRAYELYQARGGEHGSDLTDWLEAERAIREEARTPATPPAPVIDIERHAALIPTVTPPPPTPRAVGDDGRTSKDRPSTERRRAR